MNQQFRVAQATGTGNPNNASPPRIFKLTKPFTDQSVVVNLGYDQKVQVDFTAIANEKITLVHIGEKLIILFDNQSTVTIEPFFDSRHDQLGNLTIEVAPGRDLTVSEFASSFPITTDSSVLPAAGTDVGQANAQASGAHFTNPTVDPLDTPPGLPLLGPETLPGFEVTLPTGPALQSAAASTPDATIVKSFTTTPNDPADAGQVDHAGQVINYTVVVTNNGNETLTGLVVTDSQGNILTGGQSTLAVGASETLTGTHTVTQQDIDNGTPIINTASVTDNQGVTGTSTVSTPIDQDPSVSIVKTYTTTPSDPSDPSGATGVADHVGQVINYTVVVTNNGNETLTGLVVTDSQGNILTGGQSTLAVGASETLTGTHTVTQQDIDNGTPIINTASVTDNQGVTGTSTVSTPIDLDPSVSIVKTYTTTPSDPSDPSGATGVADHVGQMINYTVVVTNNGNETLTGLVVTDSQGNILTGGQSTLAVGASETLTGTHTVTQQDIDNGTPIINTASVTDNQGVTGTSTVSTPIDLDPSVSIVKTYTTTPSDPSDPSGTTGVADHVGQVINYTVVVTNNGNETLTGLVVTDSQGNILTGGQSTLAVGASETLTGTHTVK